MVEQTEINTAVSMTPWGGGTVGHHAPLLNFFTAPLNQLLVLSALYGKLPAMFGDHFPMLILIQGSLV